MDWVAYYLRRLSFSGLMLIGALALGGLVLVAQNFFPNIDRQTVALFGAFIVAGIVVLGLGYRRL